MGYSRAVKVSILRRVLPPNNEGISKVSEEMGITDQTIRNWVKAASRDGVKLEESTPRFMSAQEKYLLIKEAASIPATDKGVFLRERGLHSEHLTLWDQELRDIMNNKQELKNKEVKELKKRVHDLEKELHRKEKALAETAALLVLKKKIAAIMEGNEDD
jgi:transposase-like protein